MQSLNLMCLLFVIININLIFGFPPFSSHGHEYEVNYSQGGKHMITIINGAKKEIITADETLSGYNTEFFTDEIEKFPDLLTSLEYTLADLKFLNKGDTQYFYIPPLPNNDDSINEKNYKI
ncbi:uncharacterized protein LOC123272721 isoform X2 [Cotesia glomerata]|uniref:uncharacterized protein LOC123272721 isoform X2 n=1 Tax=Cotesia glomerata TaxID=32391 RepID=UPI001D0064B2|nr:uncharacterized protein LOC123272721 isoform X2 [Cotesia glomerata]